MTSAQRKPGITMNDFREQLLARQRELVDRRERLNADRRREAEALSVDAPDRAIQ
jgi:hypothetical protein